MLDRIVDVAIFESSGCVLAAHPDGGLVPRFGEAVAVI
jgi:hypothetical protein